MSSNDRSLLVQFSVGSIVMIVGAFVLGIATGHLAECRTDILSNRTVFDPTPYSVKP